MDVMHVLLLVVSGSTRKLQSSSVGGYLGLC